MKATNDFKKLKKFLASDYSNKSYLAYKLGYSSTLTIDKWIERGQIPDIRRNQVFQIIDEWSIKRCS